MKKKGAGRSIIDLLQTIVLAALVFLLVSTSFQNFEVEGSSMTPNVQNGDLIIVNKAAYRSIHVPNWLGSIPFVDPNDDGYAIPFGEPKHGEVIVFKHPLQPTRNLIKRVIGVPGDTIEIRRGVVYRNGEPLTEDYLDPDLLDNCESRFNNSEHCTKAPVHLGPNQFWAQGDERNFSSDSRDWGILPRANIIGKAWLSYWPQKQFGRITAYQVETP